MTLRWAGGFLRALSPVARSTTLSWTKVTATFVAGRRSSSISGGDKDLRVVEATPFDSNGVRILFSDGARNDFRYVWLRDCCPCSECHDPQHSFFRTSVYKLDIGIQPSAIWVTEEGGLGIKWPKLEEVSHKSIYPTEWLRRYGSCFTGDVFPVTRDTSMRPSLVLWDSARLEKEGLPQMSFKSFMASQRGLLQWLKLFYEYGFVILKDVAVSKSSIEEVANRLAYIRTSSFGYVAEVHSNPSLAIHPGYRGDPLGLHTDLPYRERSPGVLMLHVLRAADPHTVGRNDAGGQTLLADGLYVAHWMQQHHPEEFHTLSTVPVPFAYTDPTTGLHYSSYWPIIHTDPMGAIEEVHYSTFSRQPPQMPDDRVVPFYVAIKRFHEKLMESHARFYLKRGDLVAIHNRRVLHGRTAFDSSKVTRHFTSCYMDLDEVLNRYDSLLRNNNPVR